MINILKSSDRGKANHGWLKSFHTFSFAEYFNRNAMGFESLRVINEDFVQPGMGFPTHPHADMEIISYVVSGQIAHKDSMGNIKIVSKGEVQAMTAGTGVTHSEFNPSNNEVLHLLQIWIKPDKKGYTPKYSEWRPRSFDGEKLQLIASNSGRNDSIQINQNVDLLVGKYNEGEEVVLELSKSEHFWLQVVEGECEIQNNMLEAGDAINGSNLDRLNVSLKSNVTLLLFKFR